jgi:hypothetical protein
MYSVVITIKVQMASLLPAVHLHVSGTACSIDIGQGSHERPSLALLAVGAAFSVSERLDD